MNILADCCFWSTSYIYSAAHCLKLLVFMFLRRNLNPPAFVFGPLPILYLHKVLIFHGFCDRSFNSFSHSFTSIYCFHGLRHHSYLILPSIVLCHTNLHLSLSFSLFLDQFREFQIIFCCAIFLVFQTIILVLIRIFFIDSVTYKLKKCLFFQLRKLIRNAFVLEFFLNLFLGLAAYNPLKLVRCLHMNIRKSLRICV